MVSTTRLPVTDKADRFLLANRNILAILRSDSPHVQKSALKPGQALAPFAGLDLGRPLLSHPEVCTAVPGAASCLGGSACGMRSRNQLPFDAGAVETGKAVPAHALHLCRRNRSRVLKGIHRVIRRLGGQQLKVFPLPA